MTILSLTIFNLIFYSIVGWIIEEVYSFIITGRFKKEGFLKGPYKPMYGIAFTLLILFNEYFNLNIITTIMIYILVPTIVEFISGYLLLKFFNEMYWDYSKLRYNYKGLITLKFSLYWGVLSYIGITYINPVVRNFYLSLEVFIRPIIVILSIIVLVDIILTITSKLNLKKSRLLNS